MRNPHLESQFPTGHPRITVITSILTGSRLVTFFDLLPPLYRAALYDRDVVVRQFLVDGLAAMAEPDDGGTTTRSSAAQDAISDEVLQPA